MVKTLAELKRLPIGTELVKIRDLGGDCYKKRKLEKVQSNALLFSGDDFQNGKLVTLYLPSAKEFFATEKGFKFIENGELTAEYVFVEEEE